MVMSSLRGVTLAPRFPNAGGSPMSDVAEMDVMDVTAGDPDETGDLPFDTDGQLLIPGTGDGLSLKVTGKKPTTATLTLTGGKIEVSGSFDKGDRLALYVEAVVNDVGFKDTEDSKTGQVTGCERRHKARITGVRVAAGE